MTTPVVIEITDVSKKFVIKQENSVKEKILSFAKLGTSPKKSFWAVEHVTAEIFAGETVGLIGHNGSGKSTLLKLIGGILEPSHGIVRSRGRIAALLELGAGFHPDLTGRENVFLNASLLGMSKEETEAQYDNIVEFAGIADFMNTQVKFYSSGMYVRLAFAVAVHTDPDILIVDEVLAVGDEAFQLKCYEKINEFKRNGCTIVLVSHGLEQVEELCDRVILLDKGNVVYNGKPEEGVRKFREILGLTDSGPNPEFENSKDIYLESVRVECGDDNLAISQLTPITISVLTSSTQYSNSHSIAVWLETMTGHQVYGATSNGRVEPLILEEGNQRIDFVFSAGIPIAAGQYFLNAALFDDSGQRISIIRNAQNLVFTHVDSTWGQLGVSPAIIRIPTDAV